jgi:hypothetical protein
MGMSATVLQAGVHRNDDFAAGVVDACGDGGGLAELRRRSAHSGILARVPQYGGAVSVAVIQLHLPRMFPGNRRGDRRWRRGRFFLRYKQTTIERCI